MHSIHSRVALVALLGMTAVASTARSAADEKNSVRAVVPSEMKWSAVSGYPPGYTRAMLEGEADKAVPFTYRVRLPAGFTIQPHTHANDEHVTVLEGAWSVGVGDTFDASSVRTFPAGSFIVIPAGMPHFLAIEKDTIVQVHGVGPVGFRLVGDRGATTRHARGRRTGD
jgi:quercetin dioxygenase-like cupin family protein